MMWGRVMMIGALFWLAACAQKPPAESRAPTPAATPPAQANEARNRIQNWMISSISRMPDDTFLKHGVASADVPQAKSCVVQATVADIPEEPAEHIADLLEQNPPAKDEIVEEWVLSSFQRGSARNKEVMAQVGKLCPQFAGAFSS
jgi:hypothetical protein